MKPTREELIEVFSYDPATGEVRYCKRIGSGPKVGEQAGYITKRDGRRVLSFKKQRYLATHIIYVIMTGKWPDGIIDHIDAYGPKSGYGDRWSNLRVTSQQINVQNSRLAKSSSSGERGVSWHAKTKSWRARIQKNRKEIFLGLFPIFDDAVSARKAAELTIFGANCPTRSRRERGGET